MQILIRDNRITPGVCPYAIELCLLPPCITAGNDSLCGRVRTRSARPWTWRAKLPSDNGAALISKPFGGSPEANGIGHIFPFYKERQYQEELGNGTPDDVYYGRRETVPKIRP